MKPRATLAFRRFRRVATGLAALLLAAVEFAAGGFEFGQAQPAPAQAVPAGRQATSIAIITIEGPIDNVTARSVERRMKDAEAAQVDAIIFELDTPGGLATAALEICQMIKQSPITNTVAWINPRAYSAGTFIALACREIVMNKGAAFGDCAPILPGLIPVPAAERAKIESPLLAELVDSARRNGYDEKLVQSFVAVDIELWLVENVETGDRLFVDRREYRMLFGAEPEDTSLVQAGAGAPTGDGSVLPFFSESADSEKPTGMTPEERERAVEFQQSLPSSRPKLTEADRGKFRPIEAVVDSRTLLVLFTEKAERYGLSAETIATDEELKQFFGAQTLVRMNQTWSESMVQFLTSMPIRLGLVLVFAIGLIWEMATPGLGVPGGIAAAALLALVGAPALTGMAQWWDVLFIFAGIALVALEILVIPGFGLAGLAGLICLAMGFVGSFVAPDPGGGLFPTSEAGRDAVLQGLTMLLLAFFSISIVLYFGIKNFGRLPVLGHLVLHSSVERNPTSERTTLLSAMARTPAAGPAPGDLGETVTALRPVGRARIGEEIYDVIAGRGAIDAGTAIVVRRAGRFQIVVEEVTPGEGPEDHG